MNYLNLALRPSYILQILILLLHLGALFSLSQLNWLWYWKVFIAIPVIFSAIYNISRYALLRDNKSIVQIGVTHSDEWLIQTKNGEIKGITVLSTSLVTKLLIILNVKVLVEKGRQNVLIFPDMLSPEQRRALRARLKF